MKKTRKKKYIIPILFFVLLLLIYFTLYYVYVNYVVPENNSKYQAIQTKTTDYSETVEDTISNSTTISDMIEHVSKSVVGISKFQDNSNSIFSENAVGTGTGIIVSDNGYILSNSHVTGEKYSSCYVTLENGNNYHAKVVWSDTDLDLSICKINAPSLTAVALGDSDSIRSGNSVFAIGNPIGFEFRRTVTSGIVSAVNRTIKLEENDSVSYMTDLIQTDATINPGNSGGPLLLPNGEIIGINTVKITSAEGIGFAVPINVVKPVIESFINWGYFEEAFIGISAYDSNVIPYLNSSSSFNFRNICCADFF